VSNRTRATGRGLRRKGALLLWLTSPLLACAPPARQGNGPQPGRAAAGGPQTPQRLRALSGGELENVVADIVGDRSLALAAGFLPDPRVSGFDNDAVALGVSESKADEIATAAARVAARISDPAFIDQHAPCPAGADPAGCAGAFVERTALRAWGRPLGEAERQRLLQVYAVGTAEGGGHAGGIALCTEALLTSPHFVYRTEIGVEGGTDPAPARLILTGHEIASAISFLMRGSRPDDALLAAAQTGELSTPEGRERQVRRLLPTAAARQQLARFVRAWLGLEDVAMLNKDLALYSLFTPLLRQALDRELTTFLDHVFTRGGRLQDLLLADYTFPSPALLPIYGEDLLGPPGEHTQVALHARRRGILSSPAFLASHAQLAGTSPVERGLIVRSRMLCDEPPPPPPDVLAQPPANAPGQTTRQKYEAHSRDPACLPCHRLIDPVGFGMEAFDAIGRYRQTEGSATVDASGELLGTDVDGPFTGPAELAELLIASGQFRRCFARKLHQFALGRVPASGDEPEINRLAMELQRADLRIDELLVALVREPGFVERRRVTEAGSRREVGP
jgi:hypothetical protein